MKLIKTLAMVTALVTNCMIVTAQAPHPERIYLSGTGIDDTKTWDFYCSGGMNSGKWKKIEVPCNWELQGFGEYTYGRYYKTKGLKPSNETGTYRTRFKADKAWQGERVKLYFDGVMTDAEVSINGQQVGERHRGGFYRFSFDITPYIKFGKQNTLEVKVYKESDNRLVNAAERKADWWLYGGIYRPVWLEVVPQTNISHFILSAKQDGTLDAAFTIEGEPDGHNIELSVVPLRERIAVRTTEGKPAVSVDLKRGMKEVMMTSKWDHVKTWDLENPNLYVAHIELKDKEGNVIQTRQERIGFRTLEFFPQDGLYINGTKVILKGVNRHSCSVDGGRTTSAALSLQDALLIKEMNMNAVRSHYPPDEHFLDVCDSLGIAYMDELAGWQNGYDTETGRKLVKEMIERDVNHPCIVIWSNGNEGGWNTEIDPLFAKYDKLEKRHLVHPWADFNDLDTHHYPAYLTGVARFTNGYKVFMPTEFMHAMYDQGGGAGMRDFWDRWLTSPMFAGGFIWAFCDEAVKRTDLGGILDSNKSNAPDGIVGPRREKEASYWAIRSQWSPIQIKPLQINSHFDGTLYLTNEYLYTSLSECRMIYKVKACPTPLQRPEAEDENRVIAEGEINIPVIEPGETGKAKIALPQNFAQGDVLEIEAFDKFGRSICTWTYPIRLAEQYFNHHLAATPSTLEMRPKATGVNESGKVVLSASGVTVEFDANTGMLLSVRSGDKAVPFNNGPIAVGMKMKYAPELSYVRNEGNDAVFCAKYMGAADSIVWRLTDRGLLYMEAVLLNRASGGGGFDDAFMDTAIKNLGLTFSYPESECTGMKWMGRGPYRVWKNRLAGTNYGIWQKEYNNTITGESFENLVYPEFKGFHANTYWATFESKSAPFTVYSLNDGIFYRVFTPEEPAGGNGKTVPDFPEGDISFLLDIPAICSYKPIEQQGPNSQPGNIRIKKGDEGLRIKLMFDFR